MAVFYNFTIRDLGRCQWLSERAAECNCSSVIGTPYQPYGLPGAVPEAFVESFLAFFALLTGMGCSIIALICAVRYFKEDRSLIAEHFMRLTDQQREAHITDIQVAALDIPFFGGIFCGSLFRAIAQEFNQSSLDLVGYYPLGCFVGGLISYVCHGNLPFSHFVYRIVQAIALDIAATYPTRALKSIYISDADYLDVLLTSSQWVTLYGKSIVMTAGAIASIEGVRSCFKKIEQKREDERIEKIKPSSSVPQKKVASTPSSRLANSMFKHYGSTERSTLNERPEKKRCCVIM